MRTLRSTKTDGMCDDAHPLTGGLRRLPPNDAENATVALLNTRIVPDSWHHSQCQKVYRHT